MQQVIYKKIVSKYKIAIAQAKRNHHAFHVNIRNVNFQNYMLITKDEIALNTGMHVQVLSFDQQNVLTSVFYLQQIQPFLPQCCISLVSTRFLSPPILHIRISKASNLHAVFLRQDGNFVVPRTRLRLAERSFAVSLSFTFGTTSRLQRPSSCNRR